MKHSFLTAAALLFLFEGYGHAQNKEPHEVTAADTLLQINSVIIDDSFTQTPASHTLEIIKKIVALNQLQMGLASTRKEIQNHPNGMAAAFAPSATKAFYDLRNDVCKEFPGMIVDADGDLKSCKDR